MKAGCLFQLGGIWVGAHYSKANRRWCINLIPCCTIWIALKGGKVPHKEQQRNEQCGAIAVMNP